MRVPWWHRPTPTDDEIEHGTPGEGRRLVTIRRDAAGDPVEQVWMDPDDAAVTDWDADIWQNESR